MEWFLLEHLLLNARKKAVGSLRNVIDWRKKLKVIAMHIWASEGMLKKKTSKQRKIILENLLLAWWFQSPSNINDPL